MLVFKLSYVYKCLLIYRNRTLCKTKKQFLLIRDTINCNNVSLTEGSLLPLNFLFCKLKTSSYIKEIQPNCASTIIIKHCFSKKKLYKFFQNQTLIPKQRGHSKINFDEFAIVLSFCYILYVTLPHTQTHKSF